MKINTTRFGQVEVQDEHLIEFPDGMIGFSALKRYLLIESASMPLVLWLQAIDASDIAFPLIEPWFFKRDFKSPVGDADKHSLKFAEQDTLKIFVVMTIPEDMNHMTVNLKAPVVINIDRARASQLILQDKNLLVRTPAHEAFSRAMTNFSVNQSAATLMREFDQDESEVWTAVNVRTRQSAASAEV